MNIVVLLKMVPDVVEELEVGADGKSLNAEFLRLIVNERDAHALEEAVLLKERHGGTVVAVAPEAPDVDEVLFTALAKGADRAVKITGLETGLGTRRLAAVVAGALPAANLLPADLLLTGCQAIDDLDGQAAPLLAQALGLPYLGLVTQVAAEAGGVTVTKEFAGGVRGEFEVTLPAVLGIQAAEKPPRYVPVAKVRAAMKSQKIETVPAAGALPAALVEVLHLAKPEAAGHAEMLTGPPAEAAGKLCAILAERGVL
jgi:electron transfer flavoprotein beta subunit